MNGDGFKLNTTSAVSCKLHRVWLTRGVVRHGWRQGHNVPTTTSKHQIRQPKTSQTDFDRNLKKTSNSAYVVLQFISKSPIHTNSQGNLLLQRANGYHSVKHNLKITINYDNSSAISGNHL